MAVANQDPSTLSEGQVPAPTREPTQPAEKAPVTEPVAEAPVEEAPTQETPTEETTTEPVKEPGNSDELLPEPKDEEPSEEETKPEDKEEKDGGDEDKEVIQWEATGDSNLDAVYDLMADAGMKPGDEAGIFDKALETGDMNQVDIALLIEKVGKARATLIMAGATQYYEGTYKAIQESKTKAFDAVGGEQNWNLIREWANEKAGSDTGFNSDLNEMRDMINKGGRSTMAAVNELKGLYEADKGSLEVSMVHGDGNTKPASGKPIDNLADMFDALQDAYKRGDKAEINRIRQRRALARR